MKRCILFIFSVVSFGILSAHPFVPGIAVADTVLKAKKAVSVKHVPAKGKGNPQDTLVTGLKDTVRKVIPVAANPDKVDTILVSSDKKGVKLKFHNNIYSVYTVDLAKSIVRLHLKDTAGNNYGSIARLLNDKNVCPNPQKVQVVMNGGMYRPDRMPQGLFIENGKQVMAMDTEQNGNGDNFHMLPNGVFALSDSGAFIITSDKYEAYSKNKNVKYATQSGPMLVIDGAMHSSFTKGSRNLNIRNAVGVVNNTKLVFVISDTRTNFNDFAALFRDVLQCKNALYLDGFVSRMYAPQVKQNSMDGDFGPMISVTGK